MLENQLQVGIYFGEDQVELPLQAINTLTALAIDWQIGTVLPTFYLEFLDVMGILQKMAWVTDGTPVKVTIRPPAAPQTHTYYFRVFRFNATSSAAGTTWKMDGYLDSVKYWLTTASTTRKGTSSAVIAEIAQECGLRFDGHTTADPQVWVPQNRTLGEWVREITKSGYAGASSLMLQGVDPEKVLHYKDFNREDPVKFSMVYGEYRDGEVPIMDYAPSSRSGLTNRLTGYRNVMRTQSTTRGVAVADELVFKSDSRIPLVNQEVRTTQTRGTQRFAPIDFGNVHAEAERAMYQNARYANLYNLSVDFLSTTWTGINIFDSVTFVSRDGQGDVDDSLAGRYKVSAQQLLIQSASYAEYICGERHGINTHVR